MLIAVVKGLLLLVFVGLVLRPDKTAALQRKVRKHGSMFKNATVTAQHKPWVMPDKKQSPWSKIVDK